MHQCTCSSTHLQPRHRRFTGGQPSPLPSDQTADTVSRCSQYHWVRNWGCVSGVETSKRIPVLIADIWTPDFTIEFSMVYHCRIWCHAPPYADENSRPLPYASQKTTAHPCMWMPTVRIITYPGSTDLTNGGSPNRELKGHRRQVPEYKLIGAKEYFSPV